MGILPPSDLIVDVIRAADPAQAQAMTSRLTQAAAASGGFEDELRQAGMPADLLAMPVGDASLAMRNATALSGTTKGAAGQDGQFRQFEAMVLSAFVQNMMPAEAGSLFGGGTAGNIWRSMLTDRISDEAAKAGGIGIAQRISASVARASVAADQLPPLPADPKAALNGKVSS